jgi:type IV pilus assembly protein PilA
VLIILAVVGGVVAAIGVMAVLAIYGVRKYIANAKTAEVRSSLIAMGYDAGMAYEAERLAPGGTIADVEHHLCSSASQPVPREAQMISGKKYQSAHSDWAVDKERDAGFACLKFEVTSPQYYQYRYEATATSFTAGGRGDLNGDGRFSDFQYQGQLINERVQLNPRMLETDPEE